MEFDNPQSHKRTPRFGSIQSAKEFLPNFWILKIGNKNETGNREIVGCAHAKVVGDVVKIGPVAVKVGFQVNDNIKNTKTINTMNDMNTMKIETFLCFY